MALNLPNFLAAPLVRSVNPALEGMFSGGVNAYQQGQRHREMLQEQAMKNALMQQYGGREKEAGIQEKLAHADFYRSPFNFMTNEQKLANAAYGEGTPEAQEALQKMFMNKAKGSTGARSELSKLNQEKMDVQNDPNLSDEQKQQRMDQIDLAINKKISDPKLRNQVVAANNLLLAFQRTNIDDLVQYSGPKGQALLKKDEALDLMGNAPPRYLRYLEAKANSELEAKEARAMYGDSIRKENQEQIKKMMNPSGFFKSPQAAKTQLSSIRNTLQETAKNLQGAMKSTAPYMRDYSEGAAPQGQNQKAGGGMMGRIRDPKTGEYKIFQIRPENIEAFRAAGGDLIE
jgi:hypothetical protein